MPCNQFGSRFCVKGIHKAKGGGGGGGSHDWEKDNK